MGTFRWLCRGLGWLGGLLWYGLLWISEGIVSLFRRLAMLLEGVYYICSVVVARGLLFNCALGLVVLLSIIFLWVVYVPAKFWLYPYPYPYPYPDFYVNQVELWKTAENRTLPVQISDQAGRYVGFLDSRTERDFVTGIKIGDNQVTLPAHIYIKGKKYPLYWDHKSVNLEVAPEKFWQCLRFLEDRHLGSWHNPNGVDLFLPGIIVGQQRGGSTIPMQLVRSLNKDYGNGLKEDANLTERLEYIYDTVFRKWNELYWAPVLKYWLYDVGGEQELARWSANHIAIIQGGDKYDVVGVGAASRVLFGKPASDLATAEQYLLAAMVILPSKFSRKDDEPRRISQGYIEWMLFGSRQPGESEESYYARRDGRAMRCNTELTDMEQRLEVESELLSLLETPLRPYKDNDVADAFAAADRSYADVFDTDDRPCVDKNNKNCAEKYEWSAVHPEKSAAFQMAGTGQQSRGPLPALLREILNQYGKDYRTIVDGIQITLDIPENIRFTHRVRTKLSSIEYSEGVDGWCKGVIDGSYRKRVIDGYYLIRKTCNGSKPNPKDQVPVTMAVADNQGRIVRFFSTDIYSSYFGTDAFRDKEKGNYNWRLETREIASVAKVAAALLLASGGNESLGRRYSNLCRPGLPSESGCYPNGGPETVLPEEAFGRSLTHAIINRLTDKGIGAGRIDEFMTALGFSIPESHEDTPARTRLALGYYAGSPQAVHGLIRYAMAYVQGQPIDDLQATTMIRKTDLRKDFKGEQPELIMKHPSNNLITPGGRTFVKKVLEAPICASNGTLRKLRKWCAAKHRDVRLHIAKTGTRGTSEDYEKDWWITGGVELADGRVYTYVLRVGDSKAFVSGGGAGYMAGLVEVALESLL